MRNTGVPRPSRVEVSIKMVGCKGFPPRQLPLETGRPLETPGSPRRSGVSEGRQHGEVGWGHGATWSTPQPGGSAGCQYKQISTNNHSFLKTPLACPIFLRTPPAQLLLIKDHLIHSQIIVCTNCLKQTEVHFTLFPKGPEGF